MKNKGKYRQTFKFCFMLVFLKVKTQNNEIYEFAS